MNFKRKKKQVKNFADMTSAEKQTQVEKLAYLFERMRLGDYVNNFNRPWRVFMMNVISGIGKGVGLTIGATLVIWFIFKIITWVVNMNVPYLSDMMKEAKMLLESRYAGTRVQPQGQNSFETKDGKTVEVIIPDNKGEKNGTKSN